MIGVWSQRRALPITGVAASARTGHLPQVLYGARLKPLVRLVPADAPVTIAGDSEEDGTDWHAAITVRGRLEGGRTACDIRLTMAERTSAMRDRAPARGAIVVGTPARMPAEQDAPVNALAVWDAAYGGQSLW